VNPSLSLGRIAGVRISINWNWLIVFALIAWTLASAVFPSQSPHLAKATYLAMAVVAAFAFFGSLLLHELGHAVEARRQGMEIEGITLWLFGGIAQFKGMFPSAAAELKVALAADASLEEFMDGVVREHHFTTYPVIDGGRVVGLLRFAAVARVSRDTWARTRVRDCMLPFDDVPQLRENEPLVDAIGELGSEPPGRALVLDDGLVVGLLSITDVGRLVASVGTRRRGRRSCARRPSRPGTGTASRTGGSSATSARARAGCARGNAAFASFAAARGTRSCC
jgi:hypothetical protein